jgi:cytochrome c553
MKNSALVFLLPLSLVGLVAAAMPDSPRSAASEEKPKSEIGAVLARCQACHNQDNPAGGLDLTSRAAAMKGGKSGAALKPNDAAHSPIFLLASAGKMPPANPLSRTEIETLKAWIDSGAAWEAVGHAAPKRAGLDWWSLQPIVRPVIPKPQKRDWVRNPIDAFVLAGLDAKKLSPAPPADKRTLIRRVYFDLIGLPPSPQEVETFLRDPDPLAYEKLIDHLLASPHYGERWGRHWLDVVRFGESMGYEYDHLRDHAWRYRDYVIQAFNSDKPYPQFLREQIAGDVLPNPTPDSIVATGFLVAAPMDEAGKNAPGKLVRLRAREEEMEDMVGLVGQTCLGLTVNCSRCHDHKFDPIPQRDYYRLKAALAGVNPGNRSIVTPAMQQANADKARKFRTRLTELQTTLATLEEPVRARLSGKRTDAAPLAKLRPYARWTFEQDARDVQAGLRGELGGGAKIHAGKLHLSGNAFLKTEPLPKDIREKTLEAWISLSSLDQRGGSALTIETDGGGQFDGIVYGEREAGKWIAGSESFARTKDLAAPKEPLADSLVHVAVVYRADNSIQIYRNGVPYAPAYTPSSGLRTYPAGRAHLLFGLRHTGANNFLNGDIEEARLYDRALTAEEIAASFQNSPVSVSLAELERNLTPPDAKQHRSLREERERLLAEMDKFASPALTYGAIASQPEPTRILLRGDVQTEGDTVTAGGIAALKTCQPDFGLPADAPEALRRLKLADWITDPRNPLTARVIVNRVWQYHFGRGIVETPNDFGYNGERPSNPALLDWLAAALKSTPTTGKNAPSPYALNWSLKKLHRLIMLSNTYRQSSHFQVNAAKVDAENRLLWRFSPRRLEAESIRDTMLAVSGQLNLTMGGASVRPFEVEKFNSSFYRLIDSDKPEHNRRTIYRMIVHSARSPLLESLDCPDPSTKTPKRMITTTPIQALELMNDTFVLRQARRFAERIEQSAGKTPAKQIQSAYALAYGRPPTTVETNRARVHLKDHSLESLCWALLNSSEFLYVR